MRRQLRSIDGPLAGATFALKNRTRLGRAADSDVQIIHDGASRQHAQIVEVGPGQHDLVDHSNNGTYVAGRKIDRHRLQLGDEVRIVGFTFVYEDAPLEQPRRGAEVYAVKMTSGRTLRRTISVLDADLPPMAGRDRGRSRSSPRPEPLRTGAEVERHPIVARQPDGSDYGGDIVSDLIEYRDLRLRSLRRDNLDAVASRRFEALEKVLAGPGDDPDPQAQRRRFRRFRVAFPARLRHGGQAGKATSPVMVVDLGAGGARVAGNRHGLSVGELAWLVIDLETGGRRRTFVFTSRVVNVYDPDHLGLLFAGAPEWESWASEA